jgi:hypothetical protein
LVTSLNGVPLRRRLLSWRKTKNVGAYYTGEMARKVKRPVIVGIDLGTTNSLVAVWQDGKAHLTTRYTVRLNTYVAVLVIAFTFACGVFVVRFLPISEWGQASILCAWITGTALHFAVNPLNEEP